MVDLDNLDLEGPPRTKAQLDFEVSDLTYDRRLSMAARRAADLFDYCSSSRPRACYVSSLARPTSG